MELNQPTPWKISISGDLGSGKTTVTKLLQQKLQVRLFSMGEAWRQLAQQQGLSILELNQYSETHPLDEQMDQVLIDLAAAPEPIIFDSRLAWHFVPQSFKVYLTVSPEVAAARIFNDQQRSGAESYQDLAQAYQQIVARRQSENQRYQQKYGIDCANPANYDLVVDSSDLTPAAVAKIIEESFQAWLLEQGEKEEGKG